MKAARLFCYSLYNLKIKRRGYAHLLKEIQLPQPYLLIPHVVLAKQKPFTPDALAKLSPICQRRQFAVAVAPDAQGALSIWGVVTGPSLLTCEVAIVDPGYIVVRHFISNVAIFCAEKGAIYLREPGKLDISQHLADVLSMGETLQEREPSISGRLIILFRAMLRLGRGGTVLIVRLLEGEWRKSIRKPVSYELCPIYDAVPIRDHSIASIPEAKTAQESIQWAEYKSTQEAQINWEVDRLADLTTVDGALIITPDLEVIGFGAKIHTAPSEATTVVKWDMSQGTEERIALDKIGGTRHQSAAMFVAKHHDCLAVVASQDKRLTLFRWDETSRHVRAERIDWWIR